MKIVEQKPVTSKPRRTQQPAKVIFATGSQAYRYRQPTCAYRDWSFRPERGVAKEGQ